MQLIEKPELGMFMTFEPMKKMPIYNWLYYKEAFSRELVHHYLENLKMAEPIFDPFCGVGTTLLACKEKNFQSFGTDVLPISILSSGVKTEDYSDEDVEGIRKVKEGLFSGKFERMEEKWEFELFPVNKLLSKYAINDVLFFRKKIAGIEDEKARNFFMLALLSIIPEVGTMVKDGGVLKTRMKKHVPPVKIALKRRLKNMIRDLEKNRIVGKKPVVSFGDARNPIYGDGFFGGIITSPPYLNNIDYTKVYGLELSLLCSIEEVRDIRKRSLRSFIGRDEKEVKKLDAVEELMEKLRESEESRIPLIVRAYFSDMHDVLQQSYCLLKHGSSAVFVVGNAVLPNINVDVDEILAKIGELMGFESEIHVGNVRWADVGISKKRPCRESAVVFRKN